MIERRNSPASGRMAREPEKCRAIQRGLAPGKVSWSSPCVHVAAAIVDRLTVLCEHEVIALLPDQRAVHARLLNEWSGRLCFLAGKGSTHVH